MNVINGEKTWVFGDNINTDIISPPQYMDLSIEEASAYSMTAVDSLFAKQCKEGDIFVAHKNLGSGSSRETSPLTLKHLGIKAVIAESFARIFYRNCINVGIPVIECADVKKITAADVISIDIENGIIINQTSGETYTCSKIPNNVYKIIQCGGLINFLQGEIR
ncbi:3-isopropylmalate dehydratase [Photobacterium damselae]|uniref:LeuD/DmdB family oxidoreductase small subunit n=1 Tax=Photobacterium damselae TaxID=38293 RepID=UPI001F1F877D|nr:3-isopropylmalate dehydratase [Photobacterium damselae]UKA30783.1 3-isopropylmalate dehydratase [Photobacterium damselae subsp. damselae]